MSTTWEDVANELAMDEYAAEEAQRSFEEEIQGRDLQTKIDLIRAGFQESKDVISCIRSELQAASGSHCHYSIGMLASSLLELTEREVICLPLFVSGLGLTDNGSDKRVTQIKKMISRGVDPFKFICSHFEHLNKDAEAAKAALQKLVTTTFSSHQFFREENSLLKYREKVAAYRNQIVHGRVVAAERDPCYVVKFMEVWKDHVLNGLLETYALTLDENWVLTIFSNVHVDCE